MSFQWTDQVQANAIIGGTAGLLASRPSASSAGIGANYLATDAGSGAGVVYQSDGSAWSPLTNIPSMAIFVDTTSGATYVFVNGAKWLAGPSISGGGGGGAVTIADGADVALGSKADPAEADANIDATLMARMRAIADVIANGGGTILTQEMLRSQGVYLEGVDATPVTVSSDVAAALNGIEVINPNTTPVFLNLYDQLAAHTPLETPRAVLFVPAGGGSSYGGRSETYVFPLGFATACAITVTTLPNGTVSPASGCFVSAQISTP